MQGTINTLISNTVVRTVFSYRLILYSNNIKILLILTMINVWRACARDLQQSVCMSVCLSSLQRQRTTCVQQIELISEIFGDSIGFQLADFTKMLCFPNYSLSFSHGQAGYICNSLKLKYVTSSLDDHYLQQLKLPRGKFV